MIVLGIETSCDETSVAIIEQKENDDSTTTTIEEGLFLYVTHSFHNFSQMRKQEKGPKTKGVPPSHLSVAYISHPSFSRSSSLLFLNGSSSLASSHCNYYCQHSPLCPSYSSSSSRPSPCCYYYYSYVKALS